MIRNWYVFKLIRGYFKGLLLRRQWPMSQQLDELRNVLWQDSRWMAHDPKVAALTERYLDLLQPDWYKRVVVPVHIFRKQLGCDPHEKKEPVDKPAD